MYPDSRLRAFTLGVRGRLALSVVLGLAAAAAGIARLALLGWLIALVFEGTDLDALAWPLALVAAVVVLRGLLEFARVMVAHGTAAQVQFAIRRAIHDKVIALGPAWFGRERTGDVALAASDGVEQLEIYFGEFLPTLLIAILTPVGIFCFVAFLDLTVAAILVTAALVALVLPAALVHLDRRASLERARAYAAFAAEFLDAMQGLATLKVFGQSGARGRILARRATDLARGTVWVNAASALGRGVTDTAIAIGAATALAVGAWRVEAGEMELATLLIVLMMGVELFRPLRDMRAQLYAGMMGQAAAESIMRVLEARPPVPEPSCPRAPPDPPDGPALEFDDVGFAYPGEREPVHAGLAFSVARGERVAIVGSSGAGKSSIARLLLRFHDPLRGAVRVDGMDLRDMASDDLRARIAAVNQDTYLFHGTVEDNLRLGKPDATREELDAACRAANALNFIENLPSGYATVIGERGIRLSGGQRQRIAIARAILCDAPILVLDEALSSVDAEGEAVIRQALARLMRERTTLIFAHRLSSVIDADRILVLDGGRIVEQGTHDALMAKGGVYRGLMAEQARETDGTGAAAGLDRIVDGDSGEADAGDEVAVEDEPSGILAGGEDLTWLAAARALFARAAVDRLKVLLAVVFGVGRMAAFVGVGVLSALVVARLEQGGPFEGLLIALAVAAPVAGILHWMESWFAHDVSARILVDMRGRLFARLDRLAPAFMMRRRTGDLAAAATQDIETVRYFHGHTLAPAFVAVLVPAVVLGVLVWHGWPMAVALLPFLAVVTLSPFLKRKRLDRLGSHARRALGELNAFSVDTVQGVAEIAAFRGAAWRREDFSRIARDVMRARRPYYRDLTVEMALIEVATGLGGLAIVVTGTALAAGGHLDTALLPLLTLLAMAAFMPVSEIAYIGRQLADTLGAVRRNHAIESEPVPVTDGPGVGGSLRGAHATVTLDDVTFTHRGRRRPALRHVSLDIPAGASVALVGPSGAGKTTLVHLLMRFWDPDSGRILLDGHDLHAYGLDDLRGRIAFVAQDTFLFNETIRDNVMIARPDASDADLAAAIARASLDDDIAGFPDGLETVVGERGMRLSGGQRQRVAIARAWLKDAPILILDEATSHLDAVNERAIRRALRELMATRTAIVVAHRLSTVRDADLIAVMDHGRMAEQGRHDELVARGGLYGQLVRRQMAGGAMRRRD